MKAYHATTSLPTKEADTTVRAPKLDVLAFAKEMIENCKNITRAELNPHILHKIFGLEVEQTTKPVVYSAFTGSGKTVGLCAWLSKNYKQLEHKMVVAFKELELTAEFIVMFNGMVKEKSVSEHAHLKRHIAYCFGVEQEQIDKIKAKLENDKGNEMLGKILNFLSHTDATTSLCNERMIELFKSKVIITTHTSAYNLACAGVIKGTDVIYDEAPADCYDIHRLTVGETKEGHISKFTSTTGTIDQLLSGPKRVGKLLQSKVRTTTEVYHLSQPEVFELSKNRKENTTIGTLRVGVGSENTEQVADCKVVVGVQKEGPTTSDVADTYKAKAGDFTHFFVSYLDFSSFEANSLSIMTACPEATSVAVLEKLSGEKFQTVEGEVSKARRSLVASKAELFSFTEDGFRSVSASKANSASKAAKFAIDKVAKILKHFNGFAVAHGWRAAEFEKLGVKTCKLNQTGLNTFRNCSAVGVVNLDFQRPDTKIIEQHIFGEDYTRREQYVMAGGLGQSVMRSALRLPEPEETVIAYFDERVADLWKLFVGEVMG
jgi:hypothetical protein